MRLINTSNGLLEEFFGIPAPEYAILSHTWGAEEVSYKEYKKLIKKSGDLGLVGDGQKAGLIKIKKCVQLAASQDMPFVWIDTCCIDKRSSAELSEAMNSIYVWYERSEVCYAYLSDVGHPAYDFDDYWESIDDRDVQDRTFLEYISPSRWLTRGWTLQELIAPKQLDFYSANWSYITTKMRYAEPLSEITGVSERVLRKAYRPEDVNVATRMTWAAKRETTRVEDMAYCLMGLFNVSMPLLYGEGERAFLRLQEHITHASTDHTIFAWNMLLPNPGGSYETSLLYPRGLFAHSPREFQLRTGDDEYRLFEAARFPPESWSLTNRRFNLKIPNMPLKFASEEGLFKSESPKVCGDQEILAILNCICVKRGTMKSDISNIAILLGPTENAQMDGAPLPELAGLLV